jgi:DNA-binding SARP family transcriptional activator
MIELRFLGELNLGVPTGAARRQLSRPLSVAILAYLAAADSGGVTRDRLSALLWELSDHTHARHSLSNQLYIIRTSLGSEGILASADLLQLNEDVVSADVAEFKRAVRDGDLRRAASMYGGPFLDGFHLNGSGEFDRWVGVERTALAAQALDVFESLAERSASAGNPAEAVHWFQRANLHDPYNSRVALNLARALARWRDPGNGIQLLKDHARTLREDLGVEPDEEILGLIRGADFGPTTIADRSGPRASEGYGRALSRTDVVGDQRSRDIRSAEYDPVSIGGESRRPTLRRAASVVASLVLVAATVLIVGRARGDEQLDPDLMAILPVNPVGVDSTMAETATTRLHAELSDWESIEVSGQEQMAAIWSRLDASPVAQRSAAIGQRVSTRIGAGKYLTASVSPATTGIEVSAAIIGVPDGKIRASARASGDPIAFDSIIHSLIVRLVAEESGMPADRVATLQRHDPEAVRLFVRAYPDESIERNRLLREALARDSSFALAALELYDSFEGTVNPSAVADPTAQATLASWEEVASLVWSNRDRLSGADRAYARARLGWRFAEAHTARLEVAAWEEAVEVAPDRLSHWQGLFGACYTFCSSYARSWRYPLLAVHDSLLARGDSSRLEEAMEVALMAGDSARLDAYAEMLPPDAWYGRWVAALGLGREDERAAVMARLPELPHVWLNRLGNFAILTGRGLEDAEEAAQVVPIGQRPGSVYALRQAVLARERGRHEEYRRLRDRMFQLFAVNSHLEALAAANVIAEWAAFGEPETEATLDEADRALSTVIRRDSAASPDTLEVAHCYRSWLRIERGDTSSVQASARFLETEPSVRRRALARMCAPFLTYLLEREGDRIVHQKAASRLYEAVRDHPVTFGQLAGTSYTALYVSAAANLALARSFGELGYPETGFQVLERRPVRTGSWDLFGWHIDFVREEARLLAQAGEIDAALARYEKYFRFRPEPPDLASWALEWEIVREEYEALRRRADA